MHWIIVPWLLLVVAAAVAVAWKSAAAGASSGFLDFSKSPKLLFYHSRSAPASTRFEYEWELLKQSLTAANMNVSMVLLDVEIAPQFGGHATPSLEFEHHGLKEPYKGALTQAALMVFLRAKLGC